MAIFTERELAAELHISYWTVRLWRTKLGLPYFRTAGRIFYRISSVERWIDEQEKNNTTINIQDVHKISPIA